MGDLSRSKCILSLITMSIVSLNLFAMSSSSEGKDMNDEHRWWPIQKAPKGVVIAKVKMKSKRTAGEQALLIQSLSGLAAKAVNNGEFDELVWVDHKHDDYNKWYVKAKKRLGFEERGNLNAWQLLERYKEKGLVKGYIVYKEDHSGRDADFSEIDQSANIATSLSGLMDAVIIEEKVEDKAKELGLKRLFDARGKTLKWLYDNYKDKLNRNLLVTSGARNISSRATIIANKAMATSGHDQSVIDIFKWLNAPSPVTGWFHAGEGNHVKKLSRLGLHLHPGFVVNLPVLSAASHTYEGKSVEPVNPSKINFDDTKNAAAYIMSDGDNFGWLTKRFAFTKSYWGNPHHGEFPFGWTIAVGQLDQVSPDIMDLFAKTKPENVSIVEQSGGYWYPDLFAIDRPNRKEILAEHARAIWHYMKKRGSRVFSFICMDVDSESAKEAFQVFAEEMPGLVGMIGIQYYPYNGGHGEIMWFKNKDGIEIPVVTPKYAQWNHADWEGGGTPAEIAQWINEEAKEKNKKGEKSFSLTSVHCWSHFQKGNPDDPKSQEIGKTKKEYRRNDHKGPCGLTPVKWGVEAIDPVVKVVSPEELIWHIRMDHNPEQTKKVIENMK